MNVEFLRHFLLWSLFINYVILLIWFFVFIFARNFVRTIHGKWFNLSDETFDIIHYCGMSIYKIGILLLNLTPLIVLYIV